MVEHFKELFNENMINKEEEMEEFKEEQPLAQPTTEDVREIIGKSRSGTLSEKVE